MCCRRALRIESADGRSQGTHKSFNDGKCCRATVAVSTADSGSPSMMKPSKLSAINIATASERLRTTRISVQSVRSRIDSNRSSKTGSGFKIRTRVSTENTEIARWKAGILPFYRWQRQLTHPGPLRRRCRKRVRRHLVRSTEMNFSDLGKRLRPVLLDDRSCRAFYFT